MLPAKAACRFLPTLWAPRQCSTAGIVGCRSRCSPATCRPATAAANQTLLPQVLSPEARNRPQLLACSHLAKLLNRLAQLGTAAALVPSGQQLRCRPRHMLLEVIPAFCAQYFDCGICILSHSRRQQSAGGRGNAWVEKAGSWPAPTHFKPTASASAQVRLQPMAVTEGMLTRRVY